MNFLTVCEGGNVRSVSLAFALKSHGQQALACGWRFTDPKTLTMLCDWANLIVLMQTEFTIHIPPQYSKKIRIVDVGPDTYGSAFNPKLVNPLISTVKQWQAIDFKI